jgi:hypothetical protein
MLRAVRSTLQVYRSLWHIYRQRKSIAYLRYSNCYFQLSLLSNKICEPPAHYIRVTVRCAVVGFVRTTPRNPALMRDSVLESRRCHLPVYH